MNKTTKFISSNKMQAKRKQLQLSKCSKDSQMLTQVPISQRTILTSREKQLQNNAECFKINEINWFFFIKRVVKFWNGPTVVKSSIITFDQLRDSHSSFIFCGALFFKLQFIMLVSQITTFVSLSYQVPDRFSILHDIVSFPASLGQRHGGGGEEPSTFLSFL